MPADPTDPAAFEARYQAAEDPWDFAGSPYEQGRYDAIEAALGGERFARGFEPGCSVGALTVRLAAHCDHLRAVDVSASAVARAVERCRALPSVDLAVGSVDDELVPGAFDLVVFSELGYYVDGEALDALVDGIAGSVAAGGLLVACHWLGSSPDHKVHGSVVHELLQRRCVAGFEHRHHRATPGYVLDAWRRG